MEIEIALLKIEELSDKQLIAILVTQFEAENREYPLYHFNNFENTIEEMIEEIRMNKTVLDNLLTNYNKIGDDWQVQITKTVRQELDTRRKEKALVTADYLLLDPTIISFLVGIISFLLSVIQSIISVISFRKQRKKRALSNFFEFLEYIK